MRWFFGHIEIISVLRKTFFASYDQHTGCCHGRKRRRTRQNDGAACFLRTYCVNKLNHVEFLIKLKHRNCEI